eukprot:6489551-Amphidinium_carterae.1
MQRQDVLKEHIASVPDQIMQGVRPGQRTCQWQRSQEEASEIAILTAKLRRTEHNLRDLEKVAEYEHNVARNILTEGRQFYFHVRPRTLKDRTGEWSTTTPLLVAWTVTGRRAKCVGSLTSLT